MRILCALLLAVVILAPSAEAQTERGVSAEATSVTGHHDATLRITGDCGAIGADILAMAAVTDTVPDWGNLQWPPSMTIEAGDESDLIFGQVYLSGVTDYYGQGPGIDAMVGYGADGSVPASDPSWQWSVAVFNLDVGANDEYMGTVTVPYGGLYDYCYRYRYNGGPWLYCDLDGSWNGYSPEEAGALTVTGGGSATETSGAFLPLRLHTANPNPTTGRTLIAFDLPSECRLSLDVLDAAGRLVRNLIDGADRSPGRQAIWWDGRDARDRAVAPGVYFCRMRTDGYALATVIVLLR